MKLLTGPTKDDLYKADAWSGIPLREKYKLFKKFRKDEDGSALVMTLFVFLFMVTMAGIGIDMMRFEMERARLQATLDSAVLAGAGAPFGEDPGAIVEDYFVKAQLSEFLNEFEEGDVVTTANTSRVAATAMMTFDTYLMQLSGVEELTATAAATAETRIPRLEISMVLDVSGSMGDNNKLTNMRTAAKNFVTTILNSADDGNAVISIIPFNTSVSPTPTIFEALHVDQRHNYSTCLKFDDDAFNSIPIATAAAASVDATLEPITQAIYTSRTGNFDNHPSGDINNRNRSCFPEPNVRILPYSANETVLHDAIDALTAEGHTSGDQGIKWGAAMLDPSFRPVTNALIAANEVDGSLARVPVDYENGDTVKVIVMMGDGRNTESYFFRDNSNFRGPVSELFRLRHEGQRFEYAYRKYDFATRFDRPQDEVLCSDPNFFCEYQTPPATGSVDRGEYDYFIRDNETFGPGLATGPGDDIDPTPQPRCADEFVVGCDDIVDELFDGRFYANGFTRERKNGVEIVNYDDTIPGFLSRVRLSWEEAWGYMSPDEYGDRTGQRAAENEYEENRTNLQTRDKNARMLDNCTAAKNNNIVVFTIGFEINEGDVAETTLKACATSNLHYYPVEGVDINEAFGAIAGNVQSLRLTQ